MQAPSVVHPTGLYDAEDGNGGQDDSDCSFVPRRSRSGKGLAMPHSPIRLLVVDDHPLMRYGVCAMIRSQPDMTVVGEAASVEEAVQVMPGDSSRRHRA